MNKAVRLNDNLYWVGARDYDIRDFHGYSTPYGTTYNAYIVVDGNEAVLIDTVKAGFENQLIDRISDVIDPAIITRVISNHVEPDHSGALPAMLDYLPKASVITSNAGKKGLSQYYNATGWTFKTVKTGQSITVGETEINFIQTPMLHWPDSMMTYLPGSKTLVPNDAFGQHLADGEKIFADQGPIDHTMAEAKKYYANILLPYGTQATKALDALAENPVEMIAPSHGLIWRSHIEDILFNYRKWASGMTEDKAVIIYDTMWGSTKTLAEELKKGFESRNIETVVHSLKDTDISDIITDLVDARFVAMGSPTLNSNVLPTIAGCLTYMKGLAPSGKTGFVFGSYGWKSGALDNISNVMSALGWNMPLPPLEVRFSPGDDISADITNATDKLIDAAKKKPHKDVAAQ